MDLRAFKRKYSVVLVLAAFSQMGKSTEWNVIHAGMRAAECEKRRKRRPSFFYILQRLAAVASARRNVRLKRKEKNRGMPWWKKTNTFSSPLPSEHLSFRVKTTRTAWGGRRFLTTCAVLKWFWSGVRLEGKDANKLGSVWKGQSKPLTKSKKKKKKVFPKWREKVTI